METTTTTYLATNITNVYNTSANTTDYYDYDDYEDFQLSPLHYFTAVVYILDFLLGTIGNGLVIWFSIFKMKKTVNVIWFLNLSIADFTFTLFLPFSISYLLNGFHWSFGSFMCKFNSTLAFVNLFASVFLLTVISIDRLISVIFPVWCQNHRTPRLALFVVIVVWFLALLCSLPYFIFRDTEDYNYTIRCSNNYKLNGSIDDARIRHKSLVTMRFLVGFLIPFTIIVTCYSVIAQRIYRNHLTTSTKPFKVIITVIICFFVCWIPYHIFSLLELHSFYHDSDLFYKISAAIPFASSLAFMNSCVNPFLYVFIGRDFKDNICRSFHSIFEKAFNEDSVAKDLISKTKSTSNSQVV
ncbi:chemerin-like receptor 1 [Engystomops pustulosus]|uniref:chemerin-like receptor 1 n=1 Tax=Engystomops pustulosus TaxID=76066 RepID=UPI003AFA8EC2